MVSNILLTIPQLKFDNKSNLIIEQIKINRLMDPSQIECKTRVSVYLQNHILFAQNSNIFDFAIPNTTIYNQNEEEKQYCN